MPLLIRKFSALVLLALLGYSPLSAQQDADSLSNKINNDLNRPQIEMGLGFLTYYGDVGNLNGLSTSHNLNWGYHLALSNPISKSFGLNLYGMLGSIRASERLIDQDVNFESKIKMGGLAFTYNFNALLSEDRILTPYISLGIASYEFSTKTDLLDANGTPYNYWDDGTIRDIPQYASNADQAQVLKRDYSYETDMRSQSENQQTYNTRAMTIPVGAGVNLQITDAFSFRMGAELHLGLSDNVDNISDDNQYDSGKSGNDHILYSSVGLKYNLRYLKKENHVQSAEGNAIIINIEDQDNDGVADIVDLCPNTPDQTAVTEYGCPWDTDRDGVPDYLDEEMKSEKGAYVNASGVTLTEDEILAMYELFMDSLGTSTYDKSATYTADVNRGVNRRNSQNKGYRVVLSQSTNLLNDDIAQLLSVQFIKSVETESGSLYYLGTYETLDQAIQNQALLGGLESNIQFGVSGKFTDVDFEEITEASTGLELMNIDPNQVIFRVQIGAYRYRLSKNVFTEVNNLLVIDGNEGLTRYVAGSFTDLRSAAEYKVDLLLKGYEGAFVTAYRGGKRITMKDAGATVTSDTAEDISNTKEVGKIDKSLVKFTVQLESIEGRVPAEVLGKFMSLGGVRPVRGNNGITRYVYGSFQTNEEAETALSEVKNIGFNQAIVAGDFNGQIIDAEEALKIKKN